MKQIVLFFFMLCISSNILHSETYSNPATLCIGLNGESGGNYLIEIEADDTLLTGNFSL